MVLELDGSQHFEEAQERYADRTKFFHDHGIMVIRISNYEVAKDYEGVKKVILYSLQLE